MGSRYRTKIKEPSLFFVTSTLKDWLCLFTSVEMRDPLAGLLFNLFPVKAEALMGYVLMPSHVHMMIGCKSGGVQLAEFMRTFKSLSARQLYPGKGSIWMAGYDDLVIKTEKQFGTKLNYIHENPVRAGLVKRVEDWKWSSAEFWMEDKPHKVLTKSWEWLGS